jgi:hypothetical protein
VPRRVDAEERFGLLRAVCYLPCDGGDDLAVGIAHAALARGGDEDRRVEVRHPDRVGPVRVEDEILFAHSLDGLWRVSGSLMRPLAS